MDFTSVWQKMPGLKSPFNGTGKGRTRTSDWRLKSGRFKSERRHKLLVGRVTPLEQTPEGNGGFSIFLWTSDPARMSFWKML